MSTAEMVQEVEAEVEAIAAEVEAAPDQAVAEPLNVDLAAVVAEIVATQAHVAAVQEELTAEKVRVRTWYKTFIEDSWEYARDSQHCQTWEACAREAGIPGRPERGSQRSVIVTGEVLTTLSAPTLAAQTGLPRATVAAMIAGLPEDQRFVVSGREWGLTVPKVQFPDDWDPFDKDGFKKVCVCNQAREAFRDYARRNVSREVTFRNIVVTNCSAPEHDEEER